MYRLEQMVKDTAATRGNSYKVQRIVQQLLQERQAHEAFKGQANATISHQRKRLNYLEGVVSGAEQQANDAIRQRDAAETKVKELVHVMEALMTKSTLAWIKDPQELVPFAVAKPSEAQDLTQALAMSQKNRAAAVSDNEGLRETIKQKDKEFARLYERCHGSSLF